MVNTRKELADVAFEHPAGAGVVFGYLIDKVPELVHRFVRTLSHSAGIRIRSECFVEEWVEFAVERMVQKSVSNRGFVDVAGFGVGDFKMLVAAVAVSLTY